MDDEELEVMVDGGAVVDAEDEVVDGQ